MIESEIISIMKREVSNITKTGKPPAPGAFPKWLYYMDHQFGCSLRASLTASTKIGNRTRVFHADYNLKTKRHTYHIDGVEYSGD